VRRRSLSAARSATELADRKANVGHSDAQLSRCDERT
jgi:hypothetical protein